MADQAAARVAERVLVAGSATVLVLAGLAGWLGLRVEAANAVESRRPLFVEAARATAVELTTVDYDHVRDDVQRVLDSTTGDFHQRFAEHAQSLIDTVTRERSRSVSAVTATAVQSQSRDEARVLVALGVASTHLGGTEQRPHEMRMRLTVQWIGGQAKVSDVEYMT